MENLSFMTALLCALVYWFVCWFDDYAGTALSRPIVLGPITGLVLGDIQTGVIMGASLEAVYMGVSPIGTVMSSNTRLSTVLGVALAINSGLDMEAALALVVPIGSLMTFINPFQTALRALTYPMFVKCAEKDNMTGFRLTRALNTVILYQGLATLVLFFCVLFGVEVVEVAIGYLPVFLVDGLNAAGKMLVVVGLALTAQSLWSKKTIYFVLLGFVLAAFLGLSTVPVAIIGLVIVANIFFIRMEIKKCPKPTRNPMMEVTISMADQKNALTKEEKKLLNKTWRLSLQSKVGGTQVVQQGTSMAWTLRPTLDQLYKDDREGWLRVFRRHLGEYLNTNAVFFNLILGMVMSMEKKHKDGEIDSSVISSVKASLMGPTAGIGDSLFFSCLRVVIAGVCIGLASTGSILAPILFLVLYTGIEYICRYVLLRIGYTSGTKIVDMAFGKGIIPLITEAASCLGAIMVGCLIYNNVSVTLGITATFNELTVDLQSILDSICPGLLALGLWWLTFKGLQKGKSPIYLIFAIMIGCVVLSFFGIITVAKGGWG